MAMDPVCGMAVDPAKAGATVEHQGRKYFFWKSGSSFEHALSLNLWLKQMVHFCGPGNTQRILERNAVKPHVFLDHAQWIEEMSEQ